MDKMERSLIYISTVIKNSNVMLLRKKTKMVVTLKLETRFELYEKIYNPFFEKCYLLSGLNIIFFKPGQIVR